MNTDITFSPITINSLIIKNRLVMSSMVTQYAASNGEVTDQMINYYAERARGGVGLIMIEATYVERQGNSYRLGLGIDSDAMLPGLTRLTHPCLRRQGRHSAATRRADSEPPDERRPGQTGLVHSRHHPL